MDLKYTHGTQIFCVRACYHDDAADLVAIAGDQVVEVIQCGVKSLKVIATFHLGLRCTALAWSTRTTSPSVSEDWFIELAASTHDFGLHLLTTSPTSPPSSFHFGGGLTGHHARINDIAFVGGRDAASNSRHLASVSDDKNLIVWDLYPPSVHHDSAYPSPSPTPGSSSEDGFGAERRGRRPPTALVIPFAHPLTSVASHPSTQKEFLVADARGSVFLTDWRRDPSVDPASPGGGEHEEELDVDVQPQWAQQSVLEFTHPRVLGDAVSNLGSYWTGCAAWRPDNPDIIGAVFGSGYALWDIANLQGGKPFATGSGVPDGGRKFRWSPTYPEYFALSSTSPTRGASLYFHNTAYLTAQPPTVLSIAPRPQRLLDFDWLATKGVPRVAAAAERSLYVFPISVES